MIISKIHITNFRGVKALRLDDLTAATILLGPNGVGKTTTLDALRMVFCGRCFDATGKQIEKADLIGPHGKFASISIVFDGSQAQNNPVEAYLNIKASGTKLQVQDAKGFDVFPEANGLQQTRAALCDWLGIEDPRHLETALNPRAYLLGPDLGSVLADLCGGGITTEAIAAHLGEHSEAVAALCKSGGLTLSAECLAAIGTQAYQQRTAVNKEIAAVEKAIAELQGAEQPLDNKGNPIAPAEIPNFENLLADLQGKRDDLIREEGRAKARIEAAEGGAEKRRTLAAKLATQKVAIEDARAEKEKADAAYHEMCAAIETARGHHRKIREQQQDAEREADSAREALEAITGQNNTPCESCPTCGRKYTEKLKKTLLGKLEDALHAAYVERDKLTAAFDDATDKLAALENEYTAVATAAREAEERLNTEENQHYAIELELAAIPSGDDLPDVNAIAKKIAGLGERITNGEVNLNNLRNWDNLKHKEAALETLREERLHLEWMVTQFRDGEFTKSVLADSKGEFETRLNECLEPYDYVLRVVIDGKHVGVEMRKQGVSGAAFVPLAQCSKAELVLAGWAVASAFGDRAPVALDDLDALYGPTKTRFLSELKARSDKAPVFIAGAWTMGDVDLEPIRRYLAPATVQWIGGEAKAETRKGAA